MGGLEFFRSTATLIAEAERSDLRHRCRYRTGLSRSDAAGAEAL